MGNVVVELLNTHDVSAGTDELTGVWLVQHGLADVSTVDVEPAGPRLEGSGPIERALAILAGSDWARLKVCRAEDCRWAFYDASRNQVRRWCSMSGCGNHVKMRRAYQARKSRAHRPTATNPEP